MWTLWIVAALAQDVTTPVEPEQPPIVVVTPPPPLPDLSATPALRRHGQRDVAIGAVLVLVAAPVGVGVTLATRGVCQGSFECFAPLFYGFGSTALVSLAGTTMLAVGAGELIVDAARHPKRVTMTVGPRAIGVRGKF